MAKVKGSNPRPYSKTQDLVRYYSRSASLEKTGPPSYLSIFNQKNLDNISTVSD